MYINTVTNKYPVSEQEIRQEFGNTSFCIPFVAPEPYENVFPSPVPTYDVITQGYREIAPGKSALNQWEQRYEVYSLPQEQIDTNTQAQKDRTLQSFVGALESLYDTKAKERHYDNRFTCALRAGYAGPFQAEGIAFAVWMDTCNATGYTVLAEVQAGQRPVPTLEEFLALLPVLTWP